MIMTKFPRSREIIYAIGHLVIASTPPVSQMMVALNREIWLDTKSATINDGYISQGYWALGLGTLCHLTLPGLVLTLIPPGYSGCM